jgi:hypothetical protein
MIAHALTIVANELDSHLVADYGATANSVRLANLAEGVAGGGAGPGAVPRDLLALSVVNASEEKALKNVPAATRDMATLRVTYEQPPVHLNFLILVVATHGNYANALTVLSRAIRFFQSRPSFDQDSVLPSSLTRNAPANALDRLESFRLIFDLHSASMEEVNHLWGTLGGKQYPFVLYRLRLLELRFRATLGQGGLITEVIAAFDHKQPAA